MRFNRCLATCSLIGIIALGAACSAQPQAATTAPAKPAAPAATTAPAPTKAAAPAATAAPAKPAASGTREVVDMAKRKVTIPAKVSKIACLPGPTYEMFFAMGGKDQIGFVREDHKSAYPLAKLTNPDIGRYSSQITQVGPKTDINIEEFINAAPDLVVYYNIPQALAQFETAKIPSIVVTHPTGNLKTVPELFADIKDKVALVANVIGGDAPSRSDRWAKYYDEKVNFILSRTEKLTAVQRPKVYIGNSYGPNPLAVWGDGAGYDLNIEVAGGTLVSKGAGSQQFPEVTMEQVIQWAPEVIFVDNHGRQPDQVIADLKKDSRWSTIPAIKNNKIHRMPSGVFFLDKSSAVPVFLLWASKTLHPDLFADVDLVTETKGYFKQLYGYDLSDEQAQKVLAGWNE